MRAAFLHSVSEVTLRFLTVVRLKRLPTSISVQSAQLTSSAPSEQSATLLHTDPSSMHFISAVQRNGQLVAFTAVTWASLKSTVATNAARHVVVGPTVEGTLTTTAAISPSAMAVGVGRIPVPQSRKALQRFAYDEWAPNPFAPPQLTLRRIRDVDERNETVMTFDKLTKSVCATLMVANVVPGGTGIVHVPILELIQSMTHACEIDELCRRKLLRFAKKTSRGSSGLKRSASAESLVNWLGSRFAVLAAMAMLELLEEAARSVVNAPLVPWSGNPDTDEVTLPSSASALEANNVPLKYWQRDAAYATLAWSTDSCTQPEKKPFIASPPNAPSNVAVWVGDRSSTTSAVVAKSLG